MTDETASTETTTAETSTTATTATTTETASPEWLASLPDDLKTDKTLVKYKDTEALARGHLETKRLASSKLSLPGEGASEEDLNNFWNAIGRPEKADDYDIKTIQLPVDASDDDRAKLADATKPFKELAHKLGLTGAQATALSEFDLNRSAAYYAEGESEVAALKEKLGKDYEPKREAAQKAFQQIFGDDQKLLDEIDRKVGSGRLMTGMMRLAELMGEAKMVDSDTIEGFGEVADAQTKLDQLQGDKTWRQKLNDGDATVVAQRRRLLELAGRQAMRRQPGA